MRKTILLIIFGVLFAGLVNAQVANYTFAQSTNTYSAITGTNISFGGVTTAWTDHVASVAIPFTFNFNGTGYTTCNVNSNGYLTFGATAPSTTGYTPISSITAYAGAVSAFGRDLTNNGTAISYTTINSSPNRIFIVEWKSARRATSNVGVSGDVLNFQIRLYETSNVAEVMYGTCTATSATVYTTQVGLRGAANTDYDNRSGTGAWNATTAGGSNAATVNSTNTLMPGSGLTFTYTPTATVTISSAHPAAGNISQNSTGNIIASVQLVVSNNCPVTPSGFVFTTAGTYSGTTDITNFKLYQNNSNSLGGATLLQTISAPATGNTLTFNTGFTAVSASATVYYIIVSDVPSTAINGNTVSITSTSFSNITFTNTATIKSGTNPVAASNTKAILAPLVTVTQSHPAAAFINQGAANNIIASFKLDALNASITPSGITVTTAGTYVATTDISTFKIYQNSANNLTGATQLGSLSATASGTNLVFTFTGNTINTASTNYLLVTADVPSTATNGNTVSITSTALSNFSFTSTGTVTKTGPSNPVIAGNVQTIKAPLATISQAHPASAFINQNSTNNIIASFSVLAANAAITPSGVTFTTAGTYVVTDITNFKLYQNSSNNLTGATLIGTVTATGTGTTLSISGTGTSIAAAATGYLLLVSDVTSTATNGNTVSITTTALSNFSFTSTGTVSKTGPTIPVPASNTQTIKSPLATITQAHPAAGFITQNTANNIIAAFSVAASNAAIVPSGLTFTTAGTYVAVTDITNFKLYQNSSNNLTGATLIGTITATGTGTTLSISGTGTSIAAATTGYLLLTADAATTVTVNNTVSISATALANFSFTSTGAVTKTGSVIPVPASNTQTLIGPQVTISAVHPAAGFINQNTLSNIIASFKLDAASGNITPSNITLTTSGSYTAITDISDFKLYQNNSNNLTGATLVGTIAATASGTNISFSTGFNAISGGTTNYLILTADAAVTAIDGKTITITSTNFSNLSFTSTAVVTKFGTDPVTAPAAPGQTIKAPLITINGAHPAAANIIAGTANNVIASFSLAAANAAITPTGLSFTSAGSYLAATDITNFKLYQNSVNNLSGTPVLVGTVTATGSGTTIVISGCGNSIAAGSSSYLILTADLSVSATVNNTVFTQLISPLTNFTFSSTGSVTVSGSAPAGNIQTIKGPQADIAAAHPAAGFINQNSTNNIIASYSMLPSNGAVSPTGITFTTAGTYVAVTDITNFKLYQNSSNNLTGATLVGTVTATASGTSMVISGTGNSVAVGVTNYLILTADIASTAGNGNTVNITAVTPVSKFTFTASAGVTVTGTASAGNIQTIKSPLVTIASTHTAAANILAGTNQNIIASFSIVPSNATVTPTGITFTSAGTYLATTDITNFKLYHNTSNSLSGSPVLIGTATATASGTSMIISGTGNSVAVGVTSYLILTVDVAITATNNNTVSIASLTPLSNFTFSSTGTVTVTGSATASNIQTIKTPQVTITAVHPSAGTISQNTNKNIIATFKLDALYNYVIPTSLTVTTAGTYIPTTDITQFSLYQNNSNNLTTPTLLGSITVTGPAPDVLTFTTTRGDAIPAGSTQYLHVTVNVPLTGTDGNTVSINATPIANFSFEGQSGESVTKVGTDPATIGPVKTITGPRVTILQVHPATANITQGSNDNQIAAYELSVTNLSSGFVNPVSVGLTTGGTYTAGDITSFTLWQNSANTLTGATIVGSISGSAYASGQVLTFSPGFSSIANAGYSYLILTANVSSTATLTKTVRINANAYTNFSFLSSIGGTVSKLGTDPTPQSNLQTIVGPVAAVSTAHNLAGNILVGSTDNLLASFQVVVSNADISPATIKFTTSSGTYTGSSDIANFKLYQNSSNSLTGATLAGTIAASGTSQTLNFTTGFTAIPAGTTGYLLLIADVAGTATASRNVSIAATALSNFTFTSTAVVSKTGLTTLSASNSQTILPKLDVYSSGTKNWYNAGTANWGQNTGGASGGYANSVWISNGIAQFEGTAGQVSITNTVTSDQIKSIVNNYKIDASSTSYGVTLTTPSIINVTTGTTYTGYANTNPVIFGANGFTKTGSGELQVGSDFASTFAGTVYINGGELTLGKKAGGYNALSSLNSNPISLNNGSLTLAASSGANASLQNLTSVTCAGNDTIGLYSTSSSSAYLNVAPVTNTSAFSSTNAVPLSISGRLTVDNGGSANTKGDFANATNQNFIAFGSTTYTGDVTFQAYASNASLKKRTGDMININLGGYGHYITGVAVASGTIDDNGYSTTFFGSGGTATDGGEIGFNATASNMTGDWIIGDVAGTNAAWVVTNTSTCLTRGAITINNYSKLNLQLSTPGNSTITYSPSIINVYGLGPYSKTNSYTFGSALDFYDFARATDTITLPCNVTLNPVYNSNLASIGVMIGDDSTSASSGSLAAFQLNGTLSGTGGLEKTGPGILILNAQNGSGLVNTYADSTRIIRGTICVNSGSNLGTGPVVMYQIKKNNTALNFYNSDQTVGSLASVWNDNSGQSQIITLNGTILTSNQSASTTFGNGTGTSVGYIAGTGSLIKDGTGTLTLTGVNTYTGLTQVKGGVLELKNASGTTLPVDNDVDIIGGTLLASVSQTLNNVTLSSGNLTLAANTTLTVTGTFTMVPGSTNITLGTNAKIVYGSEATLNYAGNALQQTSVNAKELPYTNPPKNITFSNFSAAGVQWTADLTLTGTATVYGWVDMNGKTISGTGSSFTLYGLSEKSLEVNTTAGSAIISNVNTANVKIGMQVTGTGIPANATVIYIDPLSYKTVTLNVAATSTGTNILTFGFRGGLIVSLPTGIDAHIQVPGTKNYKSGASYIFKTPTSGTTIYPAFPTDGVLNYSPAWDVTITSGVGSQVIMGTHQDLTISHNLSLTTGIYVSNKNLITWDNANGGVLTAPNIPFTFNTDSSVVKQSFIALCDATGSPIGDTSGGKGFRINNVTSTEVYFPIGYNFSKTPNRMSLQNFGTTDYFTVTLAKGDIGNTPYPVVRRIWHVKEGVLGGSAVTMKLFFIKQDNTKYGISQDEVESAFDYGDIHLIHRLGNLFQNNSNGADIKNFISGYNYGTELYGIYTRGVSTDNNGASNGITQFSPFSIANVHSIILPATLVNLKAYQAGSIVKVDWTSLSENNIASYHLQRSADAVNFEDIGLLPPTSNASQQKDYTLPDASPLAGNNYYRIAMEDKDGKITYSNIALVNITNAKQGIAIYPNPVKGKIAILQFTNMQQDKYTITLYNAAGSKLLQQTVQHAGGSASYQLTLPEFFANGLYHVSINSSTIKMQKNLLVE